MIQEKQLKELFKYIEQKWDIAVEVSHKTDIKRIFGGVLFEDIMNDTLHEVKAEPQMTEKGKIDHILTNKLTWKPMGNKRFYANWFSSESDDGYRQVHFVDYNNPHSGYFETRIFNIDLSEWQPVETEQPSSQVILDNSFDKDRFERMFCAVYQSTTSNFDKCIEYTKENLTKLDAFYASKEKGGNNG